MIKKNVVKLCLIIITSLILPSTYILGNTNKSDVKIKVFRLNDKKEFSTKELNNEDGLFFCCEVNEDDLGRIEVSSKSETTITIQIENNETKKLLLSGSVNLNGPEYLSVVGNKMTFGVFPWVKACDYGGTGLTVRVFSNDEPIFQFKYYSTVCD